MYRKLNLVIALSVSLINLQLVKANWPQFHGPSAGVTEDGVLPSKWSTTENVVWTAEIPGRGWSCPIIWGDRIFVTSAIGISNTVSPKKGLYLGGERDKPSDKTHLWMVYCIDFNTGKVLWEKIAHQGVPKHSLHIKNTYASETPVTDGERVYAYFGNVGLFCYDINGKELWSKAFDSYKIRYNWGTAASPVLYKDWIFIVNDNEEQSYAIAFGKKTGTQMWRIDRDEKSNWATPYIWENEKRTELVTSGTGKVRSYDLNGELLWELGGMSSIVIPTPFAKHGLLYVTSGFVGDRKRRPIFAIRPGAKGDITLEEGQNSNEYIVWSHKLGGPYNPTPIVYGDYLYVLYDRGMMSCYEAETGHEIYSRKQIKLALTASPASDHPRAFTASPVANHGRIFCLSEDGDTFVIQAGPQFKILNKNALGEMCMATPAVHRGSLVIRTLSKLYRISD